MAGKKAIKEEKPLEIVAQLTGFRNLATGGWRLSMDLFDSRPVDIASVSLLVNDQANVSVILKPLDEKIILESLAKTGRLVVADNAAPFNGFSSEVAALAAGKGFKVAPKHGLAGLGNVVGPDYEVQVC